MLSSELDLVLKIARATSSPTRSTSIVIDDKQQYERLVPLRRDVHARAHQGREAVQRTRSPSSTSTASRTRSRRALSRKVPLPSGGYLIIDQAEALTAIDVNTGRYVGKGSKDLEETTLKTNLEAVNEIAYQLRFRNIGGLVILDLIDMDSRSNREKVWRTLEQRLAKDKAKTTINRISELGLIEMTRKRTRESLDAHDARDLLLLRRHRSDAVEAPRSPTRSCARSGASGTRCSGLLGGGERAPGRRRRDEWARRRRR